MAKAKAKAKTKAQATHLKLVLGKTKDAFKIALDGKQVTSTLGTTWSAGKPKQQSYATPEKAKLAYDKLVAAKRQAGFREVGEIDVPTIPIARDEALEAAIREDRADPAPYLVYADWLQTQGSPVGEMIVFAHKKQQPRAKAIAKQLGLPQPEMATMGWRFGLWQWLRLENDLDWMDGSWDPMPFVRALFRSPLCAVLEELRIGILRWDENDQPDVIAEAGRHGWAKDLARLHLGDVDDTIDMAHHTIGDVGKLITKHFPNLTSLKLHSGDQSWRGGKESFGIGGLELPRLKDLTIETCAMSSKRMKAVLGAKLPVLERLELWFGGRDSEATAKIADVVPVLDGKLFPRVRHLGLRNCELVTDLVRLLPSRKLAKQLEVLDLSMGTMNDEDAGELAGAAAKFPALETLNVDDSWLSSAGLRALKAAFKGVKIVSKNQRQSDDDDDDDEADNRYASVTE